MSSEQKKTQDKNEQNIFWFIQIVICYAHKRLNTNILLIFWQFFHMGSRLQQIGLSRFFLPLKDR
jgi:hypothetical protein